MNKPVRKGDILASGIQMIESRYPLRVVRTLPRGAAAHVSESDALDLLVEKLPGLSLLDLCRAEADLAEVLGRNVGMLLTTSGTGEAHVEPLP